MIHHHHHHVVPLAWTFLTLSHHFSLSFIASGRSSKLHPVSSHSCCMHVRTGCPDFARPYVGVHRSTSLMSPSLLLQQCPAYLIVIATILWFTNPQCSEINIKTSYSSVSYIKNPFVRVLQFHWVFSWRMLGPGHLIINLMHLRFNYLDKKSKLHFNYLAWSKLKFHKKNCIKLSKVDRLPLICLIHWLFWEKKFKVERNQEDLESSKDYYGL